MENYRKSSRTFYDIRYQSVMITKNSKPILKADIAQSVWGSPREICRANNVEIIEGQIYHDHVHNRE